MQGISYDILKQVTDVIRSLPNYLLNKKTFVVNINVSILLKTTGSIIMNLNIKLTIQYLGHLTNICHFA